MDAINDDMRNDGHKVQKSGNLAGFVTSTGLGEWMSFDPKTREGGELLMKATLAEAADLSEEANKSINVRHFYAHDVESADEKGEVNRWTRIVVFDDKNKAFACGSMGVRKCLAILLQIRGNMPWEPPLKCTVKVRRLDGAKQWMTLEPDIDSLYPADVPKKK